MKDPVDSSALGFHHLTHVFDPATGGKTPGDAVAGPDDFAQRLTDHPHLVASEPEPVEALGLRGVSIDVRVRSGQPRRSKDCGKVAGDCVVTFVGKIEPIVYGSESSGRFYVLEQPDGKELVVEPASALLQGTEPRLRGRARLGHRHRRRLTPAGLRASGPGNRLNATRVM